LLIVANIQRHTVTEEFSYDKHASCSKILVTVRYGARAIEFQKGKDAIEVQSVTELADTLQTVRKAVAEGELDDLLAKYAQYGRGVKKE
jgi:hypothetical protein